MTHKLYKSKGSDMVYVLKLDPTIQVSVADGIRDTKTGVVYPRTDKDVTLTILGEKITHAYEWFLNLAKFNVYVPYSHKHRIKDITFRSFGKFYSAYTEMLIQTKEPILIDADHALLLTMTNRAISKTGLIVDATTLKPVINIITTLSKGYLYFSEQGLINRKLIHRLLLEAWVWNDNPQAKFQGNHLDGNKSNNVYENLEWVSPKDNIRHAVMIGLQTDNITCMVRNKNTKEIINFMSITDMCIFLKCAVRTKLEYLNMKLGHLVNGYEIRVIGDDRDWFYKKGNEEPIPIWATKTYDVYTNNVLVMRFYTRTDVNNFLGIDERTLTTDINNALEKQHSPYIVKITELKRYGPYQAKNVFTGEIVESATLTQLASSVGLNESTVNRVIRNCEDNKSFNGWVLRYATKEPWCVEIHAAMTNTQKNKIKVVNLITNSETIFDSIHDASNITKITRTTIRSYLNSGKKYLNQLFIRL